jgi:LPXTG-motif cell wall-anchored protein
LVEIYRANKGKIVLNLKVIQEGLSLKPYNLLKQFARPSRRLVLVLMIALLIGIGLSGVLAPTLIAQAGFTPTPAPPTPTNTPLPTPTSTPVPPGTTPEPPPLLPQTGGSSSFPAAFLGLILLAFAGFGWVGINLRKENASRNNQYRINRK